MSIQIIQEALTAYFVACLWGVLQPPFCAQILSCPSKIFDLECDFLNTAYYCFCWSVCYFVAYRFIIT